jgi:hypothetical protein
MKKSKRFTYQRRDDAYAFINIDLPEPGRIRNDAVRAAVEEVEKQRAKHERREQAIVSKTKELIRAEALVETEGNKAVEGEKNSHKAALARVTALRADIEADEDNQPRSVKKTDLAVNEVLRAWISERKNWTRDLEAEARDHAAELTAVKLTVDRLIEDFDCTLGVLAGYSQYDTNPRIRAAITPHAAQVDLAAASESLRLALIALDERGY